MPTLSTPHDSRLSGTVFVLPGGVSNSSVLLLKGAMRSSRRFYGASEVLHDYPLPITWDLGGYIRLLYPTFMKINNLRNRSEGWNGYNAAAPDSSAIQSALSWVVSLFFETVAADRPWLEPHVTSGPNGEVVLEWWNGDRNLEVYVEDQRVEYLKATSSDPETEILDGDASSEGVRANLWRWLTDS